MDTLHTFHLKTSKLIFESPSTMRYEYPFALANWTSHITIDASATSSSQLGIFLAHQCMILQLSSWIMTTIHALSFVCCIHITFNIYRGGGLCYTHWSPTLSTFSQLLSFRIWNNCFPTIWSMAIIGFAPYRALPNLYYSY